MTIDWNLVVTIAVPVITLFLGAWINSRFESKARLVSYFGHVSSFVYIPMGGQPLTIHTHAVVLRNTGRKAAINVRLSHKTLPDFNIWPALQHNVETLPNGAKDIVIPSLVPGEQITISYLYFPPLTVSEINSGIKHDQGFAQQIQVLLQRQFPRWFNYTGAFFMLVGVVAALYILFEIIVWIIQLIP